MCVCVCVCMVYVYAHDDKYTVLEILFVKMYVTWFLSSSLYSSVSLTHVKKINGLFSNLCDNKNCYYNFFHRTSALQPIILHQVLGSALTGASVSGLDCLTGASTVPGLDC